MWQVVEKKNIFSSWILWHYVVSLKEIYQRWKDLLRFSLDYFSIPFLLKTLFAPWRKYKVSYGKGFNIGKILESFGFNAFSRFLGAVIRIVVIFIGFLTEALIIFFGSFIILLWIVLPLITILGLFLSLQWLIFS
jgi:hypothetical protein